MKRHHHGLGYRRNDSRGWSAGKKLFEDRNPKLRSGVDGENDEEGDAAEDVDRGNPLGWLNRGCQIHEDKRPATMTVVPSTSIPPASSIPLSPPSQGSSAAIRRRGGSRA